MINKEKLLQKIDLWLQGDITNDELEDYLDWLEVDEFMEGKEPDTYIEEIVDRANQFHPQGSITVIQMQNIYNKLKHYIETGEKLDIY